EDDLDRTGKPEGGREPGGLRVLGTRFLRPGDESPPLCRRLARLQGERAARLRRPPASSIRSHRRGGRHGAARAGRGRRGYAEASLRVARVRRGYATLFRAVRL
ncbi:MAG: hypothetical protein AVDCRST_MAG37-3296, partial [uncultured Rubrobacteraceae bacterium]